jgi:type I restriction enzyme M protein
MTPKGGIRPHKKFGVQANKAEVLFTDYIAEHLNKNGRAGIVVPNGIVATTQTAYKQLRKLLVEDSLIAVISLPAGCFNPYSGVKTSILMLDKGLAKKSEHILFIKVNNDGFDLGAQRREIDKNDLPTAQQAFTDFKQHLAEGKPFDPEAYNNLCLLVEKEKVLANKEIQLSGDRYQENSNNLTEYGWGKIEEISELFTDGDWIESKDQSPNGIRLIQTGNVGIGEYKDKATKARYISEETFKRLNCTEIFEGDVLVSRLPDPVGRACIVPSLKERIITAVDCTIIRFDKTKILPQLFVAYSKSDEYYKQLKNFISGASRDRISRKNLGQIEIPLPPLEIQEQIVKEIDGYQKIIDGAKMVVENYKPTITINPAWEMVELGKLCDVVRGSSPRPQGDPKYYGGSVPRLMVADVTRDGMYVTPIIDNLTVEGAKKSRPMKKGEVVMAVSGNPGLPSILAVDACIHDGFVGYRNLSEKILPQFLYYVLLRNMVTNKAKSDGAVFLNLTTDQIKEFPTPIPTIEEQTQIIQRIEQEQTMVNANKQLITLFEQKIKDKINEVWGVKEAVD